MPARRTALSVLFLVFLAGGAVPLHAGGRASQVTLLRRTPDGRDSLRALGPGREVHFATDGRDRMVAHAIDPGAIGRWIVTLEEPVAAGSFAERVRARRVTVDAFQSELPRRLPPRAGALGRGTPRFVRTFDRLLAGGVVEATSDDAARLRALPGVRWVTRDGPVRALLAYSVSQVRADIVRQNLGVTGRGVRVAILDSGIDYTHPAFGGGFGPGARVAGGWDFENDDADPMDDYGHGTHVAGIVGGNGGGVVGLAPEVTLYAYKVLDEKGEGRIAKIIEALERCADPDGDPGTDDVFEVVNLSLGSPAEAFEDPTTDAVNALDALGTTVVVASGNFGGPFTVASPGTARGAITVGSVNAIDGLSEFSSRGPTVDLRIKPDLVAPGEGIVSASLGGGTMARTGTSMAAPHVAGAAALLVQLHPEWSHEELRTALVGGAADVGRVASEQGSGRLDAWSAATSRWSVSPATVALGRQAPGGTWADAETLHVRSRETADVTIDLEILGTPPPGVTWSIEPAQLVLAPGAEDIAILRVRAEGTRAPWADPLYMAGGGVQLRSPGAARRVPFTVHEVLQVELTSLGSDPVAAMFDGGRGWSSRIGTTFLLPPGTYDALCTNDDLSTPFFGLTGIEVVRDTVIHMEVAPNEATLTFDLRDEKGRSVGTPGLSLVLLHEDGGGLGVLVGDPRAQVHMPRLSRDYRLEWAADARAGAVRYDIPGTIEGPLASRSITNDPSALRRLVEHVAVATTDSVLAVEYAVFPAGDDDWFGLGVYDPFATPLERSFDLVRWTAPTPYRRHLRFGHTMRTLHPARARAHARGLEENPVSGIGPVWEQDRGDTLVVLPTDLGPPLHAYTGRDLPFGSGAAWYKGTLFCAGPVLYGFSNDGYASRWFRDAAGSVAASPPAEAELNQEGYLFYNGPAIGEDRVLAPPGPWSQPLPGTGPLQVSLRSRGWTVAGVPSVTTVRASWPDLFSNLYARGPEWFAVVADGGPVERVAFGQHRDPHVFMRLPAPIENATVGIDYRHGPNGTWIPLGIQRQGVILRAPLVAAYGDISLRVRIGGLQGATLPLEMEIAPAFRGERPAAEHARVVEARADANGAHLVWDVGVPGATVVVERFTTAGGWTSRDDLIVADDGSARFDDAAVLAGSTYGYRLAGSTAEVFVRIPDGVAGLALSVAPNPSPGPVVASVTLDREAPLELALIDIQGRVVESRSVPALPPGLHVIPLAARGRLPAGLYFVRLKLGSETRTRRVTVFE